MKLTPTANVTKSLLEFKKSSTLPQSKEIVFKCSLTTNNLLSLNSPSAISIGHATNLSIKLFKQKNK